MQENLIYFVCTAVYGAVYSASDVFCYQTKSGVDFDERKKETKVF